LPQVQIQDLSPGITSYQSLGCNQIQPQDLIHAVSEGYNQCLEQIQPQSCQQYQYGLQNSSNTHPIIETFNPIYDIQKKNTFIPGYSNNNQLLLVIFLIVIIFICYVELRITKIVKNNTPKSEIVST
jgi:hypothetical protein